VLRRPVRRGPGGPAAVTDARPTGPFPGPLPAQLMSARVIRQMPTPASSTA
jgi:hypothetical protein